MPGNNNNNNNCPTDHCARVKISGETECLYKACQLAARTDVGLFTDTGVDERGENERQCENDYELKTVSYMSRRQRTDKSRCKRLRRKGLFKMKSFEFSVKLMRGQGKWRSRISSSAE